MNKIIFCALALVAGIASAQVFDTSPSGSGGATTVTTGGDVQGDGSSGDPVRLKTTVGASTASLQGQFTTVGVSTTAVAAATTTLASGDQTQFTAVGVSTTAVAAATTTLNTNDNTKFTAVGTSTTSIAAATTTLYGMRASSGTDNSITRMNQNLTLGGTLDLSAGVAMHGGLQVSTPTAKTSAYTITSADRIIFASSTVGNAITTITLPSASSMLGQVISIYKADRSTIPVVIVTPAGGADTIVGLSTVPLFSYGSGQELISDGSHTWFPFGGHLRTSESWIGHDEASNAAAALTSGTMYFSTVRVIAPCTARSVRFKIGTQSGNMSVALYDYQGNIVLSTGPFTVPAAVSNGETANLTNAVYIQPGIYYLGIGADNATATFGRYGSLGSGGYFTLANNVAPPAASITPSAPGSSNVPVIVSIMCNGAQGGYTQ